MPRVLKAFAVIISLYSLACCLLGTAYIASASDEDPSSLC